MARILIPATSPEDWKGFLAEPDKHWRSGYSARALAHCWQEADGIPPDVLSVLSQAPSLKGLETIFAIPEYQVSLPGGSRPSQNDVWVLAKANHGLVSIAVEGKVSEPFGPTIGEWFSEHSSGKERRLRFLSSELGLAYPPSQEMRYQLFHRTASAIIEAKRFRAEHAVMVVHSFSPANEWFEDYQNFLSLFGLSGEVNRVVSMNLSPKLSLHFAWVHGSERYLKV
ncbi:hypothetical protein ES702_04031 [subsurface metagenome]